MQRWIGDVGMVVAIAKRDDQEAATMWASRQAIAPTPLPLAPDQPPRKTRAPNNSMLLPCALNFA
ncbi:hypothetical protein PSP6_120012 [Paraburkholderia tropica]|nr:hypothetical protein PSP6_120012 [Paraburkholderia tropica]